MLLWAVGLIVLAFTQSRLNGESALPPARASVLSQAETQAVLASSSAADVQRTLDRYCLACHNDRVRTAGLSFESLSADRVGDAAATWERVARKIRTHEMPPPNMPRPDVETYSTVTAWLESALDRAAAARPYPGSVGVHRMNRHEYLNAIRDLFGIELNDETVLMADKPDHHSFANVASVLSVSPVLLEEYLTTAARLSRLIVADPAMSPVADTYSIPMAMNQNDRADESLPFGTRGGVAVRHHFPLDGQYTFTIRLRRQLYDYLIGMGQPHQIHIWVDGTQVGQFTVGGEAPGRAAPETYVGATQGTPEWEVYMHTADAHLSTSVPVKRGTRNVGVAFAQRRWEGEGILQPPQRGFARTTNEMYFDGEPAVDTLSIRGPEGLGRTDGSNDTSARPGGVFLCRPETQSAEEPCARRILSTLATRAYRRPVTDREVAVLLDFYAAGRADGGFEKGVQHGIERILASPNFLFRFERTPAQAEPGKPYPISDLALASRLSYFLWSSIPDDALIQVAAAGRLSNPDVLGQQVERMLQDPRASALVDNFALPWLKLGSLASVVPDVDAFPFFDENLRQAMKQETRLFIENQIREDRSVVDLITADYSYVNQRLADHYGIPNVYGSHFRRVSFDDGVRGGILGHAGVLAVTSYPNRTSPVVRGKWLLENILGSPPPPPPDDVSTDLPTTDGTDARLLSVRKQMELHRRNPTCAVCHVRMDPLGFALENFDAIGGWRTKTEAGAEIDAVASLPDGTEIAGISGLRNLINTKREDFVRTFTEKLLTYALGRGIEHYDLPTIRAVTREAAAHDYKWSALIAGIARSLPFRMSVVDDAPSAKSTVRVQ